MSRNESFRKRIAPRDVVQLYQNWQRADKLESDPLDEAQQAYEDAGFPIELHDPAAHARLLRASAEEILGRPLTKPSPASSPTSPSSTETKADVPTDSHSEDRTKKQE